ncbi:MAG TPA: hypothetical protein VFC44_26420 [Candidatus Saccharimonadales bacterium]|nr:hypothetical protein [Candidatus Saccharimonadales bacterium]
MMPEKEKPQIRQAGSAEAFVGSTATGREHHHYRHFREKRNNILKKVGSTSFLDT